MNKILTVGDIQVEVVKKNIKNMHLYVLPPEGGLRISAPHYTSDIIIEAFVLSKMDWIHKHLEKLNRLQEKCGFEFVSGERHFVWGQPYTLELSFTTGLQGVVLRGDKLVLSVRANSTVMQRQKILTEWYRSELKQRLPSLIQKWEERIGVKTESFGVKRMRTRWGTCNVRDKRIWINLNLAKKAPECLESVVVHELVHLLESNHGSKFIAYMDRFLPDWRVIKNKLNSKDSC